MSSTRDLFILSMISTLSFVAPASAEQFMGKWVGAFGGIGLSSSSLMVEDIDYGSGVVKATGSELSLLAGYNWQNGNLVFGPEFKFSSSSIEKDDGNYLRPFQYRSAAELRLKAGFSLSNFLPYIAVGKIFANVSADHDNSGVAANAQREQISATSYAVGVDWQKSETLTLRVEFSQADYGNFSFDFSDGGDPHTANVSDQKSIMFAAMMRF